MCATLSAAHKKATSNPTSRGKSKKEITPQTRTYTHLQTPTNTYTAHSTYSHTCWEVQKNLPTVSTSWAAALGMQSQKLRRRSPRLAAHHQNGIRSGKTGTGIANLCVLACCMRQTHTHTCTYIIYIAHILARSGAFSALLAAKGLDCEVVTSETESLF